VRVRGALGGFLVRFAFFPFVFFLSSFFFFSTGAGLGCWFCLYLVVFFLLGRAFFFTFWFVCSDGSVWCLVHWGARG
jgi:hypothetical protein